MGANPIVNTNVVLCEEHSSIASNKDEIEEDVGCTADERIGEDSCTVNANADLCDDLVSTASNSPRSPIAGTLTEDVVVDAVDFEADEHGVEEPHIDDAFD